MNTWTPRSEGWNCLAWGPHICHRLSSGFWGLVSSVWGSFSGDASLSLCLYVHMWCLPLCVFLSKFPPFIKTYWIRGPPCPQPDVPCILTHHVCNDHISKQGCHLRPHELGLEHMYFWKHASIFHRIPGRPMVLETTNGCSVEGVGEDVGEISATRLSKALWVSVTSKVFTLRCIGFWMAGWYD